MYLFHRNFAVPVLLDVALYQFTRKNEYASLEMTHTWKFNRTKKRQRVLFRSKRKKERVASLRIAFVIWHLHHQRHHLQCLKLRLEFFFFSAGSKRMTEIAFEHLRDRIKERSCMEKREKEIIRTWLNIDCVPFNEKPNRRVLEWNASETSNDGENNVSHSQSIAHSCSHFLSRSELLTWKVLCFFSCILINHKVQRIIHQYTVWPFNLNMRQMKLHNIFSLNVIRFIFDRFCFILRSCRHPFHSQYQKNALPFSHLPYSFCHF